jgi:hypothetical protein
VGGITVRFPVKQFNHHNHFQKLDCDLALKRGETVAMVLTRASVLSQPFGCLLHSTTNNNITQDNNIIYNMIGL